MNTNNITNITVDLNDGCSPSYTEDEVTLRFESEELFADWFKNIASRHANWIKHSKRNYPGNTKYIGQDLIEPFKLESIFYVCDRYGKPRRRLQDEGASKRQKTKETIKIGCTAKLLKYIMTDESVRVSYQWQHIGHDPANIQEMIKARLPVEVREWIKKHVDRDLDWKQIKNLLRLDESRLDQLENNTRFGAMPAALFVKYKDVKNLIDARIAYLTRKHSNDKESIKLWVDTLKQEGFFSLLRFHENGPFLLSWVSPWQKKFLEEAEEWCIDSTHKTCKSLNNPAENSYLFTIVVRSPITNKGVPVCFFITDREVLSTLEQ